jgi:c-di-GMP-binding flagellar brake protein YcgR
MKNAVFRQQHANSIFWEFVMAKLKISAGDLVEILPVKQNKESPPHISVVENYDDQNTILINTPISSGNYVRLPIDEKYLLRIISKKCIFHINASVNKYISEEEVQFVEFKLLGDGKRIQQRDFFRLPYFNIINFQVRVENESGIQFSDEMHSGIIRDLSGGGMKMAAKVDIAKYEIIKFNLQLEGKSYELVGAIMFKKHDRHAVQPYTYGVMFWGISEADRDKIIFHVHHLQLESLQ